MTRLALESAQAAKGAVVQVLAEMTAMERGNSPYHLAADSRINTAGAGAAASSSGPTRMRAGNKRALVIDKQNGLSMSHFHIMLPFT